MNEHISRLNKERIQEKLDREKREIVEQEKSVEKERLINLIKESLSDLLPGEYIYSEPHDPHYRQFRKLPPVPLFYHPIIVEVRDVIYGSGIFKKPEIRKYIIIENYENILYWSFDKVKKLYDNIDKFLEGLEVN